MLKCYAIVVKKSRDVPWRISTLTSRIYNILFAIHPNHLCLERQILCRTDVVPAALD